MRPASRNRRFPRLRPGRGASRFAGRLAALPKDDSGSALVFVIAVFLFLFVLILSVYSVGETIRRKEELQNACDAAAYSAAVVQADGLSRMAVVNRAMAWTHIQTTKMQMDYITYKWLQRVRDCFVADMDNIKETDMEAFYKREPGYHHLKDQFRDYYGLWLNIHFNCHDGVHDNPLDARARYIGLGPNTEGGHGQAVNDASALAGGGLPLLDQHWIRINGFAATDRRLQYNPFTFDLDYYEGKSCKAARLIHNIETTSGGPGAPKLRRAIRDGKRIVLECGEMLKTVNDEMAAAIPSVAKATLYANLPRKSDGSVESSLLEDYVFAVSPGVMASSRCNPYDESVRTPTYYDPLYNCEEDEMRFLAMANGLPSGSVNVKLKDFFASLGQGGKLAAGLDQWFVRCYPDESWRDALSIKRHFAAPAKGIVRCYKNANYAEGQTGRGVLRGNYTLDGGGVSQPQKPTDIDSIIEWSFYHCPQFTPGPWWAPYLYVPPWIQEHFRVQNFESVFIAGQLGGLWSQAPYWLFSSRFSQRTDPSCVNYRTRFVDQCANVNNTWGLYAEYEWATAYWFCCWIELNPCRVPGITTPTTELLSSLSLRHEPICVHIPIPSAVFGGRNRVHYGDSDTPSGIVDDQREPYAKGSSRSQYVRTFIGADGESKYECPLHGGDGDGANMGAKGYVRIYGDDKEIIDENYVGAVAKPWVLNERFFNGMGTILVGVARRERNVFYWINRDGGPVGNGEGIFHAFTPDKNGRPQPRIVALAAARAAYAPRTGKGTGDGADSENAARREGGKWGRRYELRYDAVTSIDSRGNLGKPSLDPYRGSRKAQLEGYRIGCVCGKKETGERLRRQWNLSQTDWDAVLLPLRHAYADPSHVDRVPYDSGKHGKDALTTWSYSETGGSADSQAQLAREVLPKLTWAPLSGTGTAESWDKVFQKPNGMDEAETYKLFKKRLVH